MENDIIMIYQWYSFNEVKGDNADLSMVYSWYIKSQWTMFTSIMFNGILMEFKYTIYIYIQLLFTSITMVY